MQVLPNYCLVVYVVRCCICFRHTQHLRTPTPRIVQMGMLYNKQTNFYANQNRRLEVLHNCVKFIFENKISDARKVSASQFHTFEIICHYLKFLIFII